MLQRYEEKVDILVLFCMILVQFILDCLWFDMVCISSSNKKRDTGRKDFGIDLHIYELYIMDLLRCMCLLEAIISSFSYFFLF